MQVILKEDVPGLGRTGEVLKVKPGYARNYLIPQGIAIMADSRNIKKLEHEKNVISRRIEKNMLDSEKLKETIEEISITVAKHAGGEEKLYGSVTPRDISNALADEGINIEKKKIRIEEPIKALGVYTVSVYLHAECEASLKVWVVAR